MVIGAADIKRFTLIELLVVIAVIGILTSMLLPALQNARLNIKGAVCMSNLRQIHNISDSYSVDNDNYFIVWSKSPTEGKIVYWFREFTYTEDNYPYSLSDAELKILECPVIYSITPGDLTRGTHRNIAMNSFLPGLKSTAVDTPSEMIFLGDGYNHYTNDGTSSPGFYSWAINGNARLGGEFDYIHSSKKNLVFADGHITPKTRSFCSGTTRYWDPALQ
ncbi:MAG: type II secretion system GspH family protein [Lentisphaerales bacterium]|nr:type II secretion system GspH family protein [Lentisphaerales bacterium]